DRFTDGDAVFTDAAGEDQHVATAQHHQVGADEVADRFDERVDRQLRPLVAACGGLLDVAHVGRDAAHAEHATFFAQATQHLVPGEAVLQQLAYREGVEIAD